MRRRRWIERSLAWAGGAAAWPVWAQAPFPTRPINLLVPFAAGGIADITARAVAEPMSHTLGKTIVVDNRPSAGAIVATQAALQARPDGHTMLLVSNGHAVSVGLFRKLPYDLAHDIAPVGTLAAFDLGIFAAANARHASLRELLAAARRSPGKVSIATIAVGSTQHLAARLLESLAGVELLVVPYKTSPAVMTALRSGEVDAAVEIVAPMLPQLRAGTLRALAVAAEQRHALLPEVPTAVEEGVPGYLVASWNGLAVHAATPAPAVDALHHALQAALLTPGVQASFKALGVRPLPGAPAALRQLLAEETRRWGEVIRRAKIEPS